MKKRIILIIGLGCIALLFVGLGALFAQKKNISEAKPDETTKLLKNIKPEGWDIPDTQGAKLIDSDISNLQDLAVVRRLYELKGIYTQVDFYYLDSKGRKTVKTQDLYRTRDVVIYSYNEKIFAYKIIYLPYGVNDEGQKAPIGVPIVFYFEDGDADGKFETRYEEPDFPEKAPDWLTKVQK